MRKEYKVNSYQCKIQSTIVFIQNWKPFYQYRTYNPFTSRMIDRKWNSYYQYLTPNKYTLW